MLTEVGALEVREEARRALAEDIGSGDVTAAAVPEAARMTARVVCREAAVLCGTAWFEAVFRQLDAGIAIDWTSQDGDAISANQTVCTLRGFARPLLSGERTALNFLQTLSGTATLARRYAAAVAGLPVKVLDTRKTLPGLRRAQKYAVRCGGCQSHRRGLDDGILIKENHILAMGSITAAIARVRACSPGLSVEVEVEDLNEARQALAAGADSLLLDNFARSDLREAVRLARQRWSTLEASGNMTLENIRSIAETGVDYISVGGLTKDVRAVDLSIRFAPVVR